MTIEQASETPTGRPAAAVRAAAVEPRLPPPDHHRDVTGGWLRAAVFGVTDGLVSNAALVTGVAGGGAGQHTVLLTGLAGLLAGAASMATGEYTSVSSSNEAMLAEVAVEALELRRNPEGEQAELAAAYVARGVPPELATQVAAALSSDPEATLRVHAQEELGVDTDHLPSPLTAAGSSLAAFAVGAAVPLLPFLVGGASALVVALVLTGIALFAAGAGVSRLTSRSAGFGGGRQLLFGALACAITYAVGTAVGVGVS